VDVQANEQVSRSGAEGRPGDEGRQVAYAAGRRLAAEALSQGAAEILTGVTSQAAR
jgi:hypothetical protein